MNEILKKLRATLERNQGNLWEWRRVNPYDPHPLEILGLEREPQLTPQLITTAIQRLAQREQQGPGPRGKVSGRVKELLTSPETRVLCELLRIPPVPLPKEKIERAKSLAEPFRAPPPLPPCEDVPLRSGQALARVVEKILAEEPRFEVPTQPALTETPAPMFETPVAGVTFRQRKRKEAR